MENSIKFLSKDKSCRFLILNHQNLNDLISKNNFMSTEIKTFSEQLMVNSILLSAINSHADKISFSFRFSKDYSLFCEINANIFNYSVSDTLITSEISLNEILKKSSFMSITKGDWNTGLHTGTVSVTSTNPNKIISHYANQSEQLKILYVSDLFIKGWSIIIQPLPFVENKTLEVLWQNLTYLAKKNRTDNWKEFLIKLSDYGNIIESSNIKYY